MVGILENYDKHKFIKKIATHAMQNPAILNNASQAKCTLNVTIIDHKICCYKDLK